MRKWCSNFWGSNSTTSSFKAFLRPSLRCRAETFFRTTLFFSPALRCRAEGPFLSVILSEGCRSRRISDLSRGLDAQSRKRSVPSTPAAFARDDGVRQKENRRQKEPGFLARQLSVFDSAVRPESASRCRNDRRSRRRKCAKERRPERRDVGA